MVLNIFAAYFSCYVKNLYYIKLNVFTCLHKITITSVSKHCTDYPRDVEVALDYSSPATEVDRPRRPTGYIPTPANAGAS